LKILHIENTAGVGTNLAHGMRKLGHDADVLETWPGDTDYPVKYRNYYRGLRPSTIVNMRKTVKIAQEYDVLHIHTGCNWKRFDIVLLHRKKKPMFFHYHGSETRMGYGMAHQDYPLAKFVSTPDLLEFHKGAFLIPNPVGVDVPRDIPFDSSAVPTIGHFPTHPELKGTDMILKAVEELKAEGVKLELIHERCRTHKEIMDLMKRTHIVVDQVTQPSSGVSGQFGVISLEAMAMGKVAVASISDAVRKNFRGIPIVSCEPTKESLKSVLRHQIDNMGEAKLIGHLGVEYVNKNHSPEAAARKVLEVYRRFFPDLEIDLSKAR
jgi:glycosyltransferase involved in cell wall biosynthesis